MRWTPLPRAVWLHRPPSEEPPQEPTTEPTAEETAEPTEEPAEEPRVLGQPRLLGRREFVPYTGPRYAPYDPELE